MLKSVKRLSAKLFSSSKDGTPGSAKRDDYPSKISEDAAEATTTLVKGPSNGKRGMRRKSMPAELDTALRTAEGKAAIEDLLKGEAGTKKQMVFGQYFGMANGSGGAGGSPASPKSPSSAVPPMEVRADPGAGKAAAAAAIAAHKYEFLKLDSKGISTVKEDEEVLVVAQSSPKAAPQQQQQHQVSSSRTSTEIESESAPRPPKPNTKVLAVSKNLPVSMNRTHWQLADYQIGRKMYTGYASTVYQATCKKSLDQVALKIYHMENLCDLNHYQVYREVRVHSSLHHQNIIHLFAAFQEGPDVVMVQEYAEGGDLYRLLHKNGGRLGERQAVEMVLHPFLLSLHYLHTRGIMHRDIKPENVLFTEHRVLKLADFGLAIDLNEERAVTRAGTLDYMAPEVLRCPPKNLPEENKGNTALHYNNSVDAWAVGVFAYELVVGFPPFAGETQLDSVDRIMHSTPDFPEKMTELAKAFICQALKKHPGDRPTVMEMLHHPWIRTYQRRTSMLHIPPTHRRRNSSVTPPMGPMVPGLSASPAGSGLAAKASPGAVASTMSHLPGSMAKNSLMYDRESGDSLSKKNPEDMSPSDIEEMIRRLQVAKQVALDREASKSGASSNSGSIPGSVSGNKMHPSHLSHTNTVGR